MEKPTREAGSGPEVFKEDLAEAKARMAAWWEGRPLAGNQDREGVKGREGYRDREGHRDRDGHRDRPVIAYRYQRPGLTEVHPFDPWYLARHPDDFTGHVVQFERNAATYVYGAEAIPMLDVNYGPGVLAAVLGCEPRFYKRTVWFDRPTPVDEVVDLLEGAKCSPNNPWYARLLAATETAARASRGRYSVGVTDLGGILDVLASFVGGTELIVAMHRRPAVVDTCRRILLERWHQVYDALVAILDRYDLGCNAWLDVWCPEHWYPIQCDFSAALSPKWFRRFVLPDLEEQCARLDYCIYHWDGPGQLPYRDDILSIEGLTGVQWVPGVGQPPMGAEKWTPLYRKVLAAGKRVVASVALPDLTPFYDRLDPAGVYARCPAIGSALFAEFFLPAFAGGMGGVDPDEP